MRLGVGLSVAPGTLARHKGRLGVTCRGALRFYVVIPLALSVLAKGARDLLLRLRVGLNVAPGPFHPEERRVARHLALRFDRSAGYFSPASSPYPYLCILRGWGRGSPAMAGTCFQRHRQSCLCSPRWKRGHSCPRKGASPFTRLPVPPALTKEGSALANGTNPRVAHRKAPSRLPGAASALLTLAVVGHG